MKTSLLAGAAMLLPLSVPAWSADAGATISDTPFNWSGAYVGAVGSYNWGRTEWGFVNPGGTNADHDSDGAGIGTTFGYNWQLANDVVFGIEGDLSWLDAKGDILCPNPAFTCHSKLTWLGTVRSRLGYSMDRLMPYVTGGMAAGKVKLWSPAGSLPAISDSQTAIGWAAGAGLEYAFTDHITAKLEYLHIDLGKSTYFKGTVDDSRGQWRDDSVRIGLNYKF